MGVTKNFGSGITPVDVLTAFKSEAQKPYTSVFVKFGEGRHSFGAAEFYTMKELAKEINYTTRVYNLERRRNQFTAALTDSTAILTFDNKKIYGDFMDAMIGRNIERHPLTVQISGKSREWHQAAATYLAHAASARRHQGLEESSVHQKSILGFGHMLVDYTFKDIETMQAFCQEIMSQGLDLRAQQIENAGQKPQDAKPV